MADKKAPLPSDDAPLTTRKEDRIEQMGDQLPEPQGDALASKSDHQSAQGRAICLLARLHQFAPFHGEYSVGRAGGRGAHPLDG